MGGVTDDITQSALDSALWRSRRGRVCRGSLFLIGCPLATVLVFPGAVTTGAGSWGGAGGMVAMEEARGTG